MKFRSNYCLIQYVNVLISETMFLSQGKYNESRPDLQGEGDKEGV